MYKSGVFLDRDRTIIEDMGYEQDPSNLGRPERVFLKPRAADGIRMLNQAGVLVAMVTNQTPIGCGYYSKEDAVAVNARVQNLLMRRAATLDAIRMCECPPWKGCDCRKPEPGMLLSVMKDYGLRSARCFMVGDAASDMEAGRKAECRTVYIGRRITEHGDEVPPYMRRADWMCDNLQEAAEWILKKLSKQ